MSGTDLAKRKGVSQLRIAQVEQAEVLGDIRVSPPKRGRTPVATNGFTPSRPVRVRLNRTCGRKLD